ncbi:MAG: hypothetical protein HQM02_09165 [Magnetococcales bacterium]|nr:hypothetical protein [Magnetococcales bacterium]
MIRSRYDKEILMKLEDGTHLSGHAKDMNAKGFFLFIDATSLDPRLQGMRGVLLEDLHGEQVTLACRIMRVNEVGVGVQFLAEE